MEEYVLLLSHYDQKGRSNMTPDDWLQKLQRVYAASEHGTSMNLKDILLYLKMEAKDLQSFKGPN